MVHFGILATNKIWQMSFRVGRGYDFAGRSTSNSVLNLNRPKEHFRE